MNSENKTPIPPCPPLDHWSSSHTINRPYADWWRDMTQRLVEYARHDDDCAHAEDYDCKCDCGLDELRGAIREAQK